MGADFSKMSTEQLRALALGESSGGRVMDNADLAMRQAEAIRNAPSPWERFGAGAADLAQGGYQKFLNWTNSPLAAQYTQEVNDQRKLFEQRRNAGELALGKTSPDFDFARLGGSAAMASLVAPFPGGQGFLGRAGMGMLQGAIPSYLNYSESNTPLGNAITTGIGAGIGAVTNVAAPYVVSGVASGAQWVKNKAVSGFNSLKNLATPQVSIDNTIRVQLSNAGVNFDELSTAAQNAIRQDAQSTLSAGGNLDPQQLLRLADIQTISGPGSATRAQVTRSPVDWSAERNLQKTEVNLPSVKEGGQETITGRLQSQDKAMKDFSVGIGNSVYGDPLYAGMNLEGRATSAHDASQRAIEAVRATDAAKNREVNKLYKAYRDTGMKDTRMPETRLTETLTKVIDEIGIDNIPPAVATRLKEFGFLGGERTRFLSIQEADTFNRLLNNNTPSHGGGRAAVTALKDALNKSLLDVPVEASAATEALKTARGAAAEMFRAREAGRGVGQAIDNAAPDKFLEQNVLGGSVRDLASLKDNLTRGTEASTWNDLRAQAWQWIHDKATVNGRKEFSGARLDTVLKNLGEERLKVLFTEPELQAINTLRRGSLAMTDPPPFSAVNYSGSGPVGIAQLLRLGNRIPLVNMATSPILSEVENTATQRLLNQSLNVSGKDAAMASVEAGDAATRAYLLKLLEGPGGGVGLLGTSPALGYASQKQKR